MTRWHFDPFLRPLAERHVLPERPRLVDVGCLFGWFTEDFLRFWPEASVLGIDMDPGAEGRFLAGHGPNVRFLARACADRDGRGTIWRAGGRSDPTELTTLVNRNHECGAMQWQPGGQTEICRLDSLVSEADFIKIDAELMDLRVIDGASKLLAARQPVGVLFELVSQTLGFDPRNPESVWSHFRPYGYELLVAGPTGLMPYAGVWGVDNLAVRAELVEVLCA